MQCEEEIEKRRKERRKERRKREREKERKRERCSTNEERSISVQCSVCPHVEVGDLGECESGEVEGVDEDVRGLEVAVGYTHTVQTPHPCGMRMVMMVMM